MESGVRRPNRRAFETHRNTLRWCWQSEEYLREKPPRAGPHSIQRQRGERIPSPSDWAHTIVPPDSSAHRGLRNYRIRIRTQWDSKRSNRAALSPPRGAPPTLRSAGSGPYSNWCVLQTFLKPHHYRRLAVFVVAGQTRSFVLGAPLPDRSTFLIPICDPALPEPKTQLTYTGRAVKP